MGASAKIRHREGELHRIGQTVPGVVPRGGRGEIHHIEAGGRPALGLNLPEADGDWAGELDGLVQFAAGGIVRIRFEPDLRLPDLAARVHRAR